MKLAEALQILQAPEPDAGPRLEVALVCGFEPLHLKTYLGAALRLTSPDDRVGVSVGTFDDLFGNLRRAVDSSAHAVVAVIEWADLDPRLGLRRTGGWRVEDLDDIVATSEESLARLDRELRAAAEAKPLVCCLPTLPFPPLFPQRPGTAGPHELRLRERSASAAAALAGCEGLRICSPQAIDALSPPAGRRDVESELATGFPYSLAHASAVATTAAALVVNRPVKKGLITDLDGTVWSGILGEVGVNGVTWELDSHGYRHALYQQLLDSLASAGVLIGVATKNDPALVAEALQRDDLLVSRHSVFPIAAHWGTKSSSVAQILAAWNIAPDAVVFVDDSAMEIAEVQEAFPAVEAIAFPESDRDLWRFLTRLRELFGKERTTREDSLRVESLRAAGELRLAAARSSHSPDEFLSRLDGRLTFCAEDSARGRAFELLGKTNQFNLNGVRMSEAQWREVLADADTSLVTVTYEDKYGPLGTIAAVLVRPDAGAAVVSAWVMSCRAFSRRIEHQTLDYLFDRFGVDEIMLEFRATERNRPVREFLHSLLAAPPEDGTVRLPREIFRERSPACVHRIADGVRD